jgi:hypothetical protein
MLMAMLFAVTTPMGVGIGLGIRTTYNENSATALGVQGTFESVRHSSSSRDNLVQSISKSRTMLHQSVVASQ